MLTSADHAEGAPVDNPVAGGWLGDFRDFSVRLWPEDSDVAAVLVTQGRQACLWVNRAQVPPHAQRWVEMWGWYAAWSRPPLDVLYVDDLAALVVLANQRGQEGG